MAHDSIDTDCYRLEDRLTDTDRAIQKQVRAFVDNEVLPIINDYWERAAFPFELIPKFADLGIVGTTIEGYGCPGLSPMAAGLIAMELGRGDGSMNTFFGVHSGLAMGSVHLLGNQEQKDRWLPQMARMERIGAFALTEPDHGSDSVGLETSARLDGDHYVLNGAKRWIGNASFADIVVIWARDESDGKVKAFILEKNEEGGYPEGYTAEVITGKIGKRAILQPDITIRDLRIPKENLLAHATSFRDATRVLVATRNSAAWESVGHAAAAYEAAVAHARTRIQFGKPLGSFQLIQNKLANMLAELTAMQLMCFRLAELAEAGQQTSTMASVAKMHTAQKARWICAEARDMLGGNGLLLENHVARHMTDMEVVSTYEGTDSIQSLLIGRDITGIAAFA
ncbi:acyl-CoA dehydrogenase family protein [Micrococcaceae bacterium Sec5.7]